MSAENDIYKEKVSTNPKDIAGSKKASMDVPAIAIAHEGCAILDGELKYGYRNWRDTPITCRRYIDAMKRHIALWEEGQECATDSGIHHLGHLRATAAILLDAQAHGTLIDDRSKHSDVFDRELEKIHEWTKERRKKEEDKR